MGGVAIAGARTRRITVSLADRAANAHASWSSRSSAVLELTGRDGTRGYGEGSPLPGYSTSTLSEVERDLAAWGARAHGELDAERDVLAQLSELCVGLHTPEARFAVETAALDLLGHALQRPAWALLAGARPPAELPVATLLSAGEPDRVVDAALRAHQRGRTTFKLKIGAADANERDLRSVLRLREVLGDEVALRLDANGALPAAALDATLGRLAAAHPEFVEEPSSDGDLSCSPVPIALDESLRAGMHTLDRAEREPVVAAVAKPMVLGGIVRTRELASAAAARGLALVLSHTFDGPVALRACTAIALALPEPQLPAGLDEHAGLADARFDPAPGGVLEAWTEPGLGVLPG